MAVSVPRVLVVTDEAVGPRMTEAASRAWELARVLALEFPTTLAAPVPIPPNAPGFALAVIPPGSDGPLALTLLCSEHDIIIARTLPLAAMPAEILAAKYLVVDLADQAIIEWLEAERGEMIGNDWLATALTAASGLLAAGDFFLCASEPQRTFWLGALTLTGRLPRAVYDRATDGRVLIDIVPPGVPAGPPQKRMRVLKGVVPEIGTNDFVALWDSGWDRWLDPLTMIDATARVRDAGYSFRMYFLDPPAPSEAVPSSPALRDATRQRSDELGLTGTHVFFHDGPVTHAERIEYLLEADVSISLAVPNLATRFATRARVLDALWAGIVPIISDGDTMADLLRAYDAGRIIPPGDDAALTLTLANLIDNPYERRLLASRGHTIGQASTWEAAAQPLLAFCHAPEKGGRVPGLTVTDLRERVTELESTLLQTRTYAERLERDLAERGGPNLAAPPEERGLGARLRRAMTGRRPNRPAPGDDEPDGAEPPGTN